MIKILSLLLLLFSCISHANSVPEGFEELFSVRETDILISLGDSSVIVPGYIGLDSVNVIDSEQVEDEISSLLSQEYVKENIANDIISNLISGVTDSKHCRGRRDECLLSEEGLKEVQFVIVNEQSLLTIHVPDAHLSTVQKSQQYIGDDHGSNALIMHHDLSVNTSAGSDAYYQNESMLGMLGGYLHSSINVTTNDDNEHDSHVYVDEINGNYLFDSYRVKAGFSSSNVSRVWNSTDILDIGEDISVVDISAGTTQELEYETRDMAPRIYFSVAKSGRLFVTREDGTPILERNISPGQHYVSYNELPRGISTLKFEVRAGESVIYEQTHKVYNKSSTALEPGEWDFFVSAGSLVDQKLVQEDAVDDYLGEYQHDAFAEFRLANQITEDLTLAIGVLNTPESYLGRAAFSYNPNNKFSINALYGVFDDQSTYWQTDLRLSQLTLSASHFDERSREDPKNREDVSFANYLMGYGSNTELSANYGFEIGIGRAYLGYSKLKNEAVRSVVFENINEVFDDSESLNVGYTFRSYYNSTIDISGSYYDNEDANGIMNDDWSVSASITVPIGSSSYVNAGVDSYEGDLNYNASIGNSYTLSENSTLSVEAGTSQSKEIDTYYGSLSGYHENDKLSGNAFVYHDKESTSISASISSSTIVTENDVFQTKEKADSYLVIENIALSDGNVSLEEKNKSEFLSVANIRKNNAHEGRLTLNSDVNLYALDSYKEYKVNLDEGASDYFNIGDSNAEASSYPGTLLNLDVDMREVKTYISVFNDIEGNPVNSMQCEGRGCIDVEEITEGVFKFRISAGLPFELRTSSQRCLIPPPHLFSTYNLGENFCMPGFDESGDLRLTQGDNGLYYYYVGEYEDSNLIQDYEASLNDSSLTFIKKSVGERIFLFVESPEQLAMNQKEAIESLSQYALEETISRPMYVSR